jgi:hypothetical protein
MASQVNELATVVDIKIKEFLQSQYTDFVKK